MANYNVELNYYNGSSYDILYPQTKDNFSFFNYTGTGNYSDINISRAPGVYKLSLWAPDFKILLIVQTPYYDSNIIKSVSPLIYFKDVNYDYYRQYSNILYTGQLNSTLTMIPYLFIIDNNAKPGQVILEYDVGYGSTNDLGYFTVYNYNGLKYYCCAIN